MKKLIISAGMSRSGSTWMYNAIRLILNKHSVKITSGWVADLDLTNTTNMFLVKIHHPRLDLIQRTNFIFYSFRDIRDVILSAQRKFNIIPTMKHIDRYVTQYYQWKKVTNYTMQYEKMIQNPTIIVKEISNILNINISADNILKELNSLDYNSQGERNGKYNMLNLFHKNHITNGSSKSWSGQLNSQFVTQIERKYKNWFLENGYILYYI